VGDQLPPVQGSGGDPDAQTRLWLNKLAEVDRKRARYQEMAAEDLIDLDELRARLADLDETRRTADLELRDLRGRQEQIRQLEQDKDALDELDAGERHRVYAMLRVEVRVAPDGSLEVSGDVINVCEMELLSL
jgi:hypothetical protein